MQVTTGSYTGNGADNRSITVGFQPDMVIVKADATQHAPWNAWGFDASLTFTAATTGLPDKIQAFEADGFQIGTHAQVNSNGVTYHWVAFRDNGEGDFTTGFYSGDGNDDRSITGVGFQPDLVIIERSGPFVGKLGVWHPSSFAGDNTLLFSALSPFADGIQAFEADGFQVGQAVTVNEAGFIYRYACFKAVAGLFAVGNYVGDGNDDRSIGGVGFEPCFAMVAMHTAVSLAPTIQRMGSMVGDASTTFRDAEALFANYIQAFEADGFQVGDGLFINHLGITAEYACWKDTEPPPPPGRRRMGQII